MYAYVKILNKTVTADSDLSFISTSMYLILPKLVDLLNGNN